MNIYNMLLTLIGYCLPLIRESIKGSIVVIGRTPVKLKNKKKTINFSKAVK